MFDYKFHLSVITFLCAHYQQFKGISFQKILQFLTDGIKFLFYGSAMFTGSIAVRIHGILGVFVD